MSLSLTSIDDICDDDNFDDFNEERIMYENITSTKPLQTPHHDISKYIIRRENNFYFFFAFFPFHCCSDANIDYKLLLANNGRYSAAKTGADVAIATNQQTGNKTTTTAVTTTTSCSQTMATNFTRSSAAAATTTTTTNLNSYDVERKYGKIPAEIYLLYLRASGFTIILIFFITALIWQALRVYTDVWLQQWTDNSNHIINLQTTTSTTLNNTNNISGLQHQQYEQQTSRNYTLNAVSVTTTAESVTEAAAAAEAGQTAAMENKLHHEVTYYFHIYAVISCVCILMAVISTPAGQWAGCKARQNLHDKLLQSIMHKSLYFFQTTPLGRIMNRFSNDMAIIDKVSASVCPRN